MGKKSCALHGVTDTAAKRLQLPRGHRLAQDLYATRISQFQAIDHL
jgi:hypothetical protein